MAANSLSSRYSIRSDEGAIPVGADGDPDGMNFAAIRLRDADPEILEPVLKRNCNGSPGELPVPLGTARPSRTGMRYCAGVQILSGPRSHGRPSCLRGSGRVRHGEQAHQPAWAAGSRLSMPLRQLKRHSVRAMARFPPRPSTNPPRPAVTGRRAVAASSPVLDD